MPLACQRLRDLLRDGVAGRPNLDLRALKPRRTRQRQLPYVRVVRLRRRRSGQLRQSTGIAVRNRQPRGVRIERGGRVASPRARTYTRLPVAIRLDGTGSARGSCRRRASRQPRTHDGA